jgi:hypothetical protein
MEQGLTSEYQRTGHSTKNRECCGQVCKSTYFTFDAFTVDNLHSQIQQFHENSVCILCSSFMELMDVFDLRKSLPNHHNYSALKTKDPGLCLPGCRPGRPGTAGPRWLPTRPPRGGCRHGRPASAAGTAGPRRLLARHASGGRGCTKMDPKMPDQ